MCEDTAAVPHSGVKAQLKRKKREEEREEERGRERKRGRKKEKRERKRERKREKERERERKREERKKGGKWNAPTETGPLPQSHAQDLFVFRVRGNPHSDVSRNTSDGPGEPV